jgi:Recombination endonuclease VII
MRDDDERNTAVADGPGCSSVGQERGESNAKDLPKCFVDRPEWDPPRYRRATCLWMRCQQCHLWFAGVASKTYVRRFCSSQCYASNTSDTRRFSKPNAKVVEWSKSRPYARERFAEMPPFDPPPRGRRSRNKPAAWAQCPSCSMWFCPLKSDNVCCSSECRTAHKAKRDKARRKTTPRHLQRRWFLRNKYKLSEQSLGVLLAAQHGLCLICRTRLDTAGRRSNSMTIDHCHETGVVRGILCRQCNVGIGCFYDNPESLAAAAEYIRARTSPAALRKRGRKTSSASRQAAIPLL